MGIGGRYHDELQVNTRRVSRYDRLDTDKGENVPRPQAHRKRIRGKKGKGNNRQHRTERRLARTRSTHDECGCVGLGVRHPSIGDGGEETVSLERLPTATSPAWTVGCTEQKRERKHHYPIITLQTCVPLCTYGVCASRVRKKGPCFLHYLPLPTSPVSLALSTRVWNRVCTTPITTRTGKEQRGLGEKRVGGIERDRASRRDKYGWPRDSVDRDKQGSCSRLRF